MNFLEKAVAICLKQGVWLMQPLSIGMVCKVMNDCI